MKDDYTTVSILTIIALVGLILIAVKLINDAYDARKANPLKVITTFELQQQLKDLGYYKGIVSGIVDKETISAWQEAIYQQETKDVEARMRQAEKDKRN